VNLWRDPGAKVAVCNQGEVPPEIRDRFFEKYATAGKKQGTGLGTYSAKLIARTHGGDVALDTSEPGFTSVIVSFPAEK
jgi:signal transduction histidine kinase